MKTILIFYWLNVKFTMISVTTSHRLTIELGRPVLPLQHCFFRGVYEERVPADKLKVLDVARPC